jgi:hypothetical protein
LDRHPLTPVLIFYGRGGVLQAGKIGLVFGLAFASLGIPQANVKSGDFVA